MIKKMNAASLKRLKHEQQVAKARLARLKTARPKKILALSFYGSTCVGGCGQREVEELFIAPIDELMNANSTMLVPGKTYRLGAVHLIGLHDWIVDQDGPTSHAVFCWTCFKRMGRVRRRAAGIVHWKHKRATLGFNARNSVQDLREEMDLYKLAKTFID